MSSREVIVGKIVAIHGVRGYMKLLSYTSPPQQIWQYKPFYIYSRSGRSATCDLKLIGRSKKVFIVSIDNVKDQDQALMMIDCEISVMRDTLPSTNEDEHYYCDLINLQVVNSKKECLGRVTNIEDHGAGAIIIWESVSGKEELHPYSEDFFGRVDLTEGKIEFLGG